MGEGLLANAEPVAEEPKEGTAETQDESIVSTEDPAGTKPVDHPEKPEYLDDQFWNDKDGVANVEALSKSYKDLRKAFNDRNNDKPGESYEDYTKDFITEEGYKYDEDSFIPADDPALKMAFEAAKESGLGVKQAQAFIEKFIAGMGEFTPAPEPKYDPEAEMEKLGPDANKIVTGLKTWVDGMLNVGDINDEVHQEILSLGRTAAGIRALDVLRQKSGEIGIPTGEAIRGTAHMSANDWYSATYETHAEAGESRAQYDDRMHEIGKKIFGTGAGTFNGAGFGMSGRR